MALRISPRLRQELLVFVPVYVVLALIALGLKLSETPAWFNGTLDRNHALLLSFNYTNNEQSRLLQFAVPELLVRLFGLSVERAYIVQRWLFVGLAFCLFHFYLRKWFTRGLAFAGVCFLAAVLPLTFIKFNDLQESAPLLMVTFLGGLWMIREQRWWLFALILLVGALGNETVLCLPALVFFVLFRGFAPRDLLRPVLITLATATPGFAAQGVMRYITRHQPHLGGAWHLPTNIGNILQELIWSPVDYFHAVYLYPLFIFGALWLYAYFGFRDKPEFVARSLWLVPLFVIPNLMTGIISEVREMVPLAFIIIPAAMFWMFPKQDDDIHRAMRVNP